MIDPISIALMIASTAAKTSPYWAPLIQGPIERRLRDQVKTGLDQINEGAGGYSTGQRNQLRMEGDQRLNAQVSEALANLSRGAGGGDGTNPYAAQADVYRAAMGAKNQNESALRGQDLAYAEQKRDKLNALGMNLVGMAQAQKTQAAKGIGDTMSGSGLMEFGQGQGARSTAGNTANSELDALDAAAKAPVPAPVPAAVPG